MRLARDALALMDGILAIIHPAQYDMARKIKQRTTKSSAECAPVLRQWSSVFTAATIISNRESPFHRDSGSAFQWYDMLTSVGKYLEAPLFLRPIGLRIHNPPGTVCAFSGMALSHSVKEIDWARVSMALYIRENMRDFVGCNPAGWMTQSFYETLIGPERGSLRETGFRDAEQELQRIVEAMRCLSLPK